MKSKIVLLMFCTAVVLGLLWPHSSRVEVVDATTDFTWEEIEVKVLADALNLNASGRKALAGEVTISQQWEIVTYATLPHNGKELVSFSFWGHWIPCGSATPALVAVSGWTMAALAALCVVVMATWPLMARYLAERADVERRPA